MSQEEIAVQHEDAAKVEEGEVVMVSGEADPSTGVVMSTRDIEEKRNRNEDEGWREQR